MSTLRKPSLGLAAVAFAALLGGARANAHSERWDPSVPRHFSLKRALLSERRSRVRLPDAPEVAWRVRVAGGVPYAPTATESGAVLLTLNTPVIAEYDAKGRLSWTARFGAAPAATSPIVLGDGTRMILSQAGEAITFSPSGRLLRRVPVPLSGLDSEPRVAATFDGGLLMASGKRIVRLDATLGVVSSVRADQEIRALLAGPERCLAVTSNGSVFELGEGGTLKRLAGFVGRIDGVVRGGDQLFAVLDGRRLVELESDEPDHDHALR
ncbi:MAG: hypothetical protein QM756_26345 [Polyangiaceae bacterium]